MKCPKCGAECVNYDRFDTERHEPFNVEDLGHTLRIVGAETADSFDFLDQAWVCENNHRIYVSRD